MDADGVGFSFDLKGDLTPGPLAAQMVRNILEWSSITEIECIDATAAAVMAYANAGKTERDFLKWCESSEVPWQLGSLDEELQRIIFTSIVFEAYSFHRLGQMRQSSTAAVLPLWRYWAGTDRCRLHASLDRFVARYDDPVWGSIYPPNGWACACSVTPMLESDLKWMLGHKFWVCGQTLQRCRSWISEFARAR